MNYDWLFSFVAFAERLNFTHTAAALHLTQPALHTQIRKLAEAVGTPLYLRQGRTITLTAEGRRLAAHGREVQAQSREVLAELRGERASVPVVLAAGQGALLYLLGGALRRLARAPWPLRVLPMPGPATLEAVRDARADVGVAVVSDLPAGLAGRELRRVGQLVVVPRRHRLAKRRKLVAGDLDGEDIIVAPEGSPHRLMLSQALASAGARWSVAVEASGWELMLQLAQCGLGITVVNDFCPVPRGFVGISLTGVPPAVYTIVSRAGRTTQPQAALVQVLIESTHREHPSA